MSQILQLVLILLKRLNNANHNDYHEFSRKLTTMDYSQTIAYWTSLCLSCAPNVNPATTAAIITIESKGNSLAIGDNTTHKSYSPKSRESAVKLAQSLLNQKHSIDIGLMQVNSIHIKSMHLNLNSLFDSCYNISVGSRILTEFYVKHSKTSSSPQEALMKAISSYNTGNPFKGYYNGYVGKMLRAVNYAFVTPQPQYPDMNLISNTNTSTDPKPETLLASVDVLGKTETLQESPEERNTSFFDPKQNTSDLKLVSADLGKSKTLQDSPEK